ncbi:MAG TPA: methionyl-tRNA formyltransferase [Candidatus Binatia bacterium]|nr:methionyl-tRNA formyltransferase [Candidatus Binatia bacterium]
MKIIFMGTAELACPSLKALCRAESFEMLAVVTQPDKPKGRDLKVQFTPVKTVALAEGLPVLQPERARNEAFIGQLRALQPDLIVVAAYGQILPQAILDLPRFGCVNVHASLLPKYRGAAPIPWAILNGDPETGVTLMKMDAGLDTGAILCQATTPIAPTDDAQTLHDRLAALGAELLVKTLPDFVSDRITPRPQPVEGASYARKITKEDGQLDWSQPARVLWCRVRGFTPWPGAFTHYSFRDQARLLKIWSAAVEPEGSGQPGTIVGADRDGILVACGQQALRVLQLQRAGGRRLGAREFLAGNDLPVGSTLIRTAGPPDH